MDRAEDLSRTFAAGRQNRVDILVGSNRDEGSFAAGFGPPMTMQRWKDSASQRWGHAAELGTRAYPVANDADAVARNNTLSTDNSSGSPASSRAAAGRQPARVHVPFRA